ncbi:hypothetical protein WUBG_18544, partial [Wuchereria bancrofti]
MGEIRSKIAEQERSIGNRNNMIPWLSHWDRQLYKTLQLQYQWGIESLHKQIPLIQVQLVFKDQQLELRPPLEEICDKIKQLMNLDLLKEIDKWKDVMGEIRSKIAEQERSIGNRNNMIPWLSHWDRQLYKTLQLQYQWGIESLHKQIPLIQVQL